MNKIARSALLLACYVTASLSQQAPMGTIHGSVVEADGNPLEGAVVYVLPASDMRNQIRTVTDKHGDFTLTHVPFGEAYISTYDTDKGYPYNFFSFFLLPGQEPKKVTLSASVPSTSVAFTLGAKAAILDVTVLDEFGKPLNVPTELIFSRSDIPGEYKRGAEAKTSLLVPPIPFKLSIEAKGFQLWTLSTSGEARSDVLTPHPGEHLSVTATLKR